MALSKRTCLQGVKKKCWSPKTQKCKRRDKKIKLVEEIKNKI